ncbi:hypothetical protein SKAU_G00241470 [Synaphobranchus kaupii]|uniref:Uncharacterized protein n=1 Tax=Synaphobranchus kaupii TaxID=118154 RepID=A0A9Q1F831_SYNKA|nr:hypothetical protein SKAU_G00241470 [Synaphobranchus kaupii]
MLKVMRGPSSRSGGDGWPLEELVLSVEEVSVRIRRTHGLERALRRERSACRQRTRACTEKRVEPLAADDLLPVQREGPLCVLCVRRRLRQGEDWELAVTLSRALIFTPLE